MVVVSSTSDKVQHATTRLQEVIKDQNLPGVVKGETLDVKDEGQVKKFFTNLGEVNHVVFTSGDALKVAFKDEDIANLKRSMPFTSHTLFGFIDNLFSCMGSSLLGSDLSGSARKDQGWWVFDAHWRYEDPSQPISVFH